MSRTYRISINRRTLGRVRFDGRRYTARERQLAQGSGRSGRTKQPQLLS